MYGRLFWKVELIPRHFPVNKIKLLCILGSEQGLKHVSDQFPGIEAGVASYRMGTFSHHEIDLGRRC